jgi:hypothetical protein
LKARIINCACRFGLLINTVDLAFDGDHAPLYLPLVSLQLVDI